MFSWIFPRRPCNCHTCEELRYLGYILKGLGVRVSQVSDAAQAVADSVAALKSSVDAAVAAIVAGSVPQSVIDSLNASKAAVDSDKAALDAALAPAPPPAG